MRVYFRFILVPLLACAVVSGCGSEASPDSQASAGASGSGSGPEAEDNNNPACVGFAGHLHPPSIPSFVQSLPGEVQQSLRMAIATQDATLFDTDQAYLTYLESNNLASVPISNPAPECQATRTLLFPAHTFEKSNEESGEVLEVTPCLGLLRNPAPQFWHCASDPAIDAFNQANCVDPAFKGLGCAPIDTTGLQVALDENPCFQLAKSAAQPIHGSTKTLLEGLGLSGPFTEQSYEIRKCVEESGPTWLVGAQVNVDDNGQAVTCHGFETKPASPMLDCFEIHPEVDPKIPEICGPRWVCLARKP